MSEEAGHGRYGKYHVIGAAETRRLDDVLLVKTVGIAGFEKVQRFHRIHATFAHDQRFARAFREHMNRAAKLHHRSAVQIFDFGSVDGALFFATEHHPGVMLHQLQVELPLALACHVLAEVASALGYAHSHRDTEGHAAELIHGHVSADHVRISRDGYVKLADFGLVRAAIEARAPFVLEAPGVAPEVREDGDITGAADVYSLACVALALLQFPAGEAPLAAALAHAIDSARPTGPAEARKDLHVELADTLGAALSPRASERPDVHELGAVLARVRLAVDPTAGPRTLARLLAPERPGSVPEGPEQPASLGAALEERRRVVAVACHLEGASVERVRQARRTLANLAYKRGAVVQADEDQWVLACFGLEVASEDDVAQAMRFSLEAALALREAEHAESLGSPSEAVVVRLGARQGVIGRRRGRALHRLGSVMGEARELAERASPGRMLLGGGPGRLARIHYAFREHPPLRRGSRKLRVLELLGRRPPTEARHGPAAYEGRFFGREVELAALEAAFTSAHSASRWCAIVGEPGSGKTRLVSELARRIAAHRPRVVRLGATPGGRDTPYALVGDTIAALLGLPAARGSGARELVGERLRDAFAEDNIDRRLADETSAAVELALELRDGAAAAFDHTTADLPGRLVAALNTMHRMLKNKRPRLVVIEDWHWIDGASREVLGALCAQPGEPGAELVILTARPDDAGRLPELPDGAHPVIHLGDLPAAEQENMIRDRLGETARPDTVALVARRAGGTPLFIEELCQGVVTHGAIDLPETARSVLAARVDRLPQHAKLVLQYAAVAGNVVPPPLVADVLGPRVHRSFKLLLKSGLLAPGPDGSTRELAFRHGLVRDTVYDGLSARARREAHRHLGDRLAQRYEAGHTASPAAIARPGPGGDKARACEYHCTAGRLSLAAGDPRAAAMAFTRALAMGDTGDAERERDALRGRADALFALGDHDAQLADLRVLERRARRSLADRSDVQLRYAARELRLGNFIACVEATRRAEVAATASRQQHAHGEALRIRSEAFERMARYPEALEACIDALEIFRRVGAEAEETRAMATMGRIHLMCSQFEEALVHYQPALDRVTASGDPLLERVIRHEVALARSARGEYSDAFAGTMAALELCQRHGDEPREGDNYSAGGAILLQVGRYAEARRWLDKALVIHDSKQSRFARADTMVTLGLCEALCGDPDRALVLLEEAARVAEDIGARYVWAHARSQMAYALLARGRPGDITRADTEASAAARIARESALVTCEIQARSRSALARLEAGDPAGALAPSLQAMLLLDRVRYIEWSTEEILFTHYLVLSELGDRRAREFLARAHEGLGAKLAKLTDPDWQASFARDVLVHRSIREAYLREFSPGS